ncbi:ABC transporter permease subunit [Mesorhizobium sp. M4B.F.Ca.ET.215.01.1.1]|uniref:ABC transporter permease subunit n=1 Tax=unclassified Mesorhizobium TaxID=325217 RepID=UPI000FD4DF13|nr:MULTISPECIES: ABC transporter permease subunit [unclassified Mesorhizobium]RUW23706.1 ABC transporter permease subunit [Mesorhizobium sp. M4B.F.Ca.ET.013.02.1.1]RWF64800.1 MAG: ABC transporter permease subunit [Mesorhizobium sp.]TGQ18290.1 ABC transporter permease subunit [Mesorhizobium sp. M4B.F.Ca.ET.215.01.1.1]TGQ27275.1 ABC transporter permease subunit [Mesorhizobium sp. M00.F.Ca.ET.220.01.1.1]TGQ28037.1 ABC transporter permease subunit [Mesorhizobium sp. M4B.F.Ca.ET.214.01.1.1]
MGGFAAQFAAAFMVTVGLALVSGFLGTVFGLLLAISKGTPAARFRSVVTAYTTVVRGVPELLIILLIYFGGTTFASKLAGRYVEVNAFTAGVIALTVVFSGYATEAFRGAIAAVPAGQTEAASSLGLKAWQRWLFIVGPQMLRLALPAYGNLWISLFKDTALVSVVGLTDIMRVAYVGAGSLRAPLTFYLAASFFYLSLTTITLLSIRLAERRYPAFSR